MGLMGRRRRVRRRRVLAAGAVAGGLAYHAGKKHQARQEEQYEGAYDAGYDQGSAQEQGQVPPAPPAPGPTEYDSISEVERLAAMHTAGDLTDDEFAAAKAKVLGT